jgi:hypothetical protein
MHSPKYIFGCLFLAAFGTSIVSAQQNKFSGPVHFNDLHTVYTYQKSNWDDSHASTIFLYIKDSAKLESFKWSEGDEWATLVSAEFDWNAFIVNKFQNHRIYAGGKRNLIAELDVVESRKIRFHVGETRDSMILADKLWQSYDFDFAGLGFSWRALKNKRDSFSFLIADAVFINNKVGFENKGMVKVDFLNEEVINGKKCLKYKIDGPGLQNKGGNIWINSDNYMIELYRISLPDEDGFVNGQLKLLKTEKLSQAEWEKFIIEKMGVK